tara:strand:+ start:1166 stop:1834 length:669 start_codon:yes stop_codon:yes gene_type:complete
MIPLHLKQFACDFHTLNRQSGVAAMADWVREVLVGCIPPQASVISIDGLDGVCKTTMGGQLSRALEIRHVDLDQYLKRKQDTFLEALNLPDLKLALSNAIAGQGGVVVTGCMMDEVLERCGTLSGYRIYAMRTRSVSIGQGQIDDVVQERELLYGEEVAEIYIEAEEEELRRFSAVSAELEGSDPNCTAPTLSGLTRELINYHKRRRPHDDADLIVKVRERP